MDVDVITISRIEHSISNTTINTLAIIAKALNVTPDQLINSWGPQRDTNTSLRMQYQLASLMNFKKYLIKACPKFQR